MNKQGPQYVGVKIDATLQGHVVLQPVAAKVAGGFTSVGEIVFDVPGAMQHIAIVMGAVLDAQTYVTARALKAVCCPDCQVKIAREQQGAIARAEELYAQQAAARAEAMKKADAANPYGAHPRRGEAPAAAETEDAKIIMLGDKRGDQ